MPAPHGQTAVWQKVCWLRVNEQKKLWSPGNVQSRDQGQFKVGAEGQLLLSWGRDEQGETVCRLCKEAAGILDSSLALNSLGGCFSPHKPSLG